jgi:hypothetical protein
MIVEKHLKIERFTGHDSKKQQHVLVKGNEGDVKYQKEKPVHSLSENGPSVILFSTISTYIECNINYRICIHIFININTSS